MQNEAEDCIPSIDEVTNVPNFVSTAFTGWWLGSDTVTQPVEANERSEITAWLWMIKNKYPWYEEIMITLN
jgi:hypothetical protein